MNRVKCLIRSSLCGVEMCTLQQRLVLFYSVFLKRAGRTGNCFFECMGKLCFFNRSWLYTKTCTICFNTIRTTEATQSRVLAVLVVLARVIACFMRRISRAISVDGLHGAFRSTRRCKWSKQRIDNFSDDSWGRNHVTKCQFWRRCSQQNANQNSKLNMKSKDTSWSRGCTWWNLCDLTNIFRTSGWKTRLNSLEFEIQNCCKAKKQSKRLFQRIFLVLLKKWKLNLLRLYAYRRIAVEKLKDYTHISYFRVVLAALLRFRDWDFSWWLVALKGF